MLKQSECTVGQRVFWVTRKYTRNSFTDSRREGKILSLHNGYAAVKPDHGSPLTIGYDALCHIGQPNPLDQMMEAMGVKDSAAQ